MRIAICDDDRVQLQYISALVHKWSAASGENIDVSLYSSAEELLFNYTPECFDVFLLDIQMDGENGISLAKRIRSYNDSASIIFITAVSDYVFEGYDVGAVQYLLKPVNEQKLFDCLDISRKKSSAVQRILFETENGSTAVNEEDIVYFEAFSHRMKVVLSGSEFFVSESLGSIAERLDNHFYKCHRSYIVNLQRVNSIKRYDAVMDNGFAVPVSRRIYNDFNNAFIAFYRR